LHSQGIWIGRVICLVKGSSCIVANLVWCVLVKFVLVERGSCWVGVTMIAFGSINFRHSCCALILAGKSQVVIILICVSSEGRIMPYCIIMPVNNHFIYNGTDDCSLTVCGRCRLASGRWGRLAGLRFGCTEQLALGCRSDLHGRA